MEVNIGQLGLAWIKLQQLKLISIYKTFKVIKFFKQQAPHKKVFMFGDNSESDKKLSDSNQNQLIQIGVG